MHLGQKRTRSLMEHRSSSVTSIIFLQLKQVQVNLVIGAEKDCPDCTGAVGKMAGGSSRIGGSESIPGDLRSGLAILNLDFKCVLSHFTFFLLITPVQTLVIIGSTRSFTWNNVVC